MTTLMPQDGDRHPIPALSLLDGGAHSISVSSTSAKNSTAFDAATRVISLYSTVDIYVKLGDSSVTATISDHFFPAGVYYDIAIGGGKRTQNAYLAALRVSSDGTLYISEKA